MEELQAMIEKAGSQSALAKRINKWCEENGVSRSVRQYTISKWLQGRRKISPVFVEPLTEVAKDLNLAFDRQDFRPDLYR